MLPDNIKRSTVAVSVGNLLSVSFGLTFGATLVHSKIYESNSTPLNRTISSSQSTWLYGHLFLSAALGSYLFSNIASKIGPKLSLLVCGLLQITGWFCIHFAYDILHIYSSRMFAGVAAGAAFTIMPIFISEISDSANRGTLIVFCESCRAFGIIIGFVMGLYVHYDLLPLVGVLISLVFIVTIPFVQESPKYYLSKGDFASFEKSLRWFRDIRNTTGDNYVEFVKEVNQIKKNTQNTLKISESEVPVSCLVKIIIYSCILSIGAELNGIYVIFTYCSEFFESTPLKFSMDENIMILAVAQFIGTMLSTWIIGSVNRKVHLIVTSFLSAMSLISALLYLTYGNNWELGDNLKPFVLLILLAAHIMFANIGIFSILSTILTEMLPTKLHITYLSKLRLMSWLITFFFIMFFSSIANVMTIRYLLLLFISGSVCLTVFSAIFLHNTSGMLSEELQYKIDCRNNDPLAQLSATNGQFKNTASDV